MKTKSLFNLRQWFAASAAIVTVGASSSVLLAVTPITRIPAVPAGVLTATPTVVQTGTKPLLAWNILYPTALIQAPPTAGSGGNTGSGSGNSGYTPGDLVQIIPPGTIVPMQETYVSVQIVGTGVTGGTSTGATPTSGSAASSITTDARVSVNGGTFQQVFYGKQSDVTPAKQLFVKKLLPNQTLDFGGRYQIGNQWSNFYTTKSANFQVVTLVNGSLPPTSTSLYQSSQLAGYLKPYLDSTGRIKVGPLSALVLMELGQTNNASSTFDLQDQVLLVTFSPKHPNNGHGNNIDGVDSSNPGNGSGGPNGAVDPSGGVDDER